MARGSMTDSDLAALLDGQINAAIDYDTSDLSSRRELAIKYYEGEVDVAAEKGRSSVVSRDVADTHGLIMPGLKRIFFGSDNIVKYEATKPGQEQFAQQATDYVNYIVMRECDGYRNLGNAMHDGVLLGNGMMKHWWDGTPEYTTEEFTGIDDAAYQKLFLKDDGTPDPDVEELEHTAYLAGEEPEALDEGDEADEPANDDEPA